MQIDIQIDKLDLTNEDPSEVVELFTEIARSSSKGNHRIIIKRKLSEWVLKHYDLGIYKGQIEKLGQKYAMQGSQLKRIGKKETPTLIVKFGEFDISQESEKKWVIGHRVLLESEYLEKTILLVEGPSDTELYSFLFEAEAQRINFGAISYVREQGGGITLHHNFKEHVTKNKRIILSICDSDRIVPNGKTGETYNEVESLANSLEFIGALSHTPGTSVENFLPLDHVKLVIPKHNTKSTKELEKIISKQVDVKKGECVWLLYNLKQAPTEKKLLDSCTTKYQKTWVKRNYGELFENSPTNKLPTFGKIVMRNFLGNEKAKNEYISEFLGSPYWNLHFSDWVHDKLWYMCGDEKYRP